MSEDLQKLDDLVGDAWFTLPDLAEFYGLGITEVRSMMADGEFLAVRRGEPKVLSVPQALVDPEPLELLPGTVTILADAGFSELEIMTWLFTPHESLIGTPVDSMRAGRRTEVRRLAQAMTF